MIKKIVLTLVMLLLLVGCSKDINDAKKEIDKIIEENNLKEIYEITLIDIGENELSADASIYKSVESFKAGSAYSWKKKDEDVSPGYIFIYQFEGDEERADFAKDLKENSHDYLNVDDKLICEYGDTVVFSKSSLSYDEGKDLSKMVIKELCE